MKLTLILITAIVGATLALPGSAWAQAPPNDTFEQATVISSLPFSQTLDTSEATTDPTDAEGASRCGLQVPPAAVWYEYTPSADQTVLVSTSGSSYTTGVGVFTGSPGVLGQTYHIGVSDVGGGSGGTLNLSVSTPGFELSVDRFGQFDPKTGVATVTGTLIAPTTPTLTCPIPNAFAFVVFGSLSQRNGNRTTTAETQTQSPIDLPCNGAAQQWSITFTPLDGKFKGGPADVSVDAVHCGFHCFLIDHADQSLILRG
jgi:hypothetical protein